MKQQNYKEAFDGLVSLMYKFEIKYKNDIDLVDKIISIYSINKTLKGKPVRILPYEKSILIYYLIYGFNKEAKETIMKDLGKTENQINTTNTNLRNKGYLFKDRNNRTKGYVSKDLKEMVDIFLNNKNKVLVTQFKK